MLLSSSEGCCLEGLVGAILLRAAMIAVVDIVAVLEEASCSWVTLWVYDLSVGLAFLSPATSRALANGAWRSRQFRNFPHRIPICTPVCCVISTDDCDKLRLYLLALAVYHSKSYGGPARCSGP